MNIQNTNFFKIEKESNIDILMEKNPYKLFVLIFSVTSNYFPSVINDTITIKKNIKNNKNTEPNTIFLFIDLRNYILKNNKYSSSIEKNSVPYISFYFNNKELAFINNAEYSVFEETFDQLKEKLAEHFKISRVESETKPTSELKEHIKQQRKLENIEKLKQQYMINELTKLKKAKELEEEEQEE